MKVNGKIFYNMVISAANALDNNKVAINNLNVFPVPDGDTGINMSLTMSTVRQLKGYDGSISDCAYKIADMILRSARGNSGAILSLFFRGMAKSFASLEEADSRDIALALENGTKEAYKAVMQPTEGTILTVMRRCAEEAVEATKTRYKEDVVGLFTYLVTVAESELARTKELLPVLRQADVVDAGGYGFVTVLKGMLSFLNNKPVEALDPVTEEQDSGPAGADFSRFNSEDVKFAYCTECIVEKDEAHLGESSASELYDFICQIGDSAVFIDDEKIIKLHVHTNNPGAVLEKAIIYGALSKIKIENMRIQHSEKIFDEQRVKESRVMRPAVKDYGFVAVCMGSGMNDTFRDLGVDNIVYGGQTMNPSTQDIINAVNMTAGRVVFVLPNNKNIYLVAKQAAEFISDKRVVVLETRNIPQGISALLSFDEGADVDTNVENMNEAIGRVTCFSTTRAVRNSAVEGLDITEGSVLGLVNEKISCVAPTTVECIDKMTGEMKHFSYVTIFYGQDAGSEDVEKVYSLLNGRLADDADIVLIDGGQPVYDFIISFE